MQTPAEKYLIKKVIEFLNLEKNKNPSNTKIKILNVGANKSIILEESIVDKFGQGFVCDRMDVVDCAVDYPVAGKSFITSVESMPEVKTNDYKIAFSNYVFEHIENLEAASSEISRVLQSGGYFVVSSPNPSAPEFVLSKYTPTKFHQFMRGEDDGDGAHAHETHYAYKNIKDFIRNFDKDFEVLEVKYWANTYGYLYKFPVFNILSKIYDVLVDLLHIRFLKGNVCIVFKKK